MTSSGYWLGALVMLTGGPHFMSSKLLLFLLHDPKQSSQLLIEFTRSPLCPPKKIWCSGILTLVSLKPEPSFEISFPQLAQCSVPQLQPLNRVTHTTWWGCGIEELVRWNSRVWLILRIEQITSSLFLLQKWKYRCINCLGKHCQKA